MLRLLARTVLALLANTIGLLAASAFLDGFNINASSFIFAVVVFSLAMIVLGPLITKIALRDMPALLGGIALVTTFVGLVITDLFTDGLSINGLSTWVLSTLIIWLCTLLASVILPMFLFKQTMQKIKDN